jgi:hypothetical protein
MYLCLLVHVPRKFFNQNLAAPSEAGLQARARLCPGCRVHPRGAQAGSALRPLCAGRQHPPGQHQQGHAAAADDRGLALIVEDAVEEAGLEDCKGANARFDGPTSIKVDTAGHIVVAESENHALRRVSKALDLDLERLSPDSDRPKRAKSAR